MVNQVSYKKSFISSIVLHIIIFSVLFLHLPTTTTIISPHHANPNNQVIQAVSVNQQAVEAEITKIKQAQAQKQVKEAQAIRELQRKAWAAKRNRVVEQRKLARIRHEQQLTARRLQQEKLATNKARERAQAQAKLAAQKLAQTKKQLAQMRIQQTKLLAEKRKAEEAKKQAALERARQKAAAQKALQAQLKAEQAKLAAAHAKIINTEVQRFAGLIQNKVDKNWIVDENINKTLQVEIKIVIKKDGTIESASIQKSSGNSILDRSALTAVQKSAPFPVPDSVEVFNQMRILQLTMRPDKIQMS